MKARRDDLPKAYSGEAYRGYFIRPDMLQREFFVQKDGYTIGTGNSIDHAKRIIDAVHGD